MATWWVTEALPIAVTALVPLVLLPPLSITDIDGAATPYANPLIFLFLGGFIIAQAMQVWRLHRRIALGIVNWVGVRPPSIVIGFILASAFLSMWVSNTATALMMLPIGLSIIDLTRDRLAERGEEMPPHFGVVLLLSIAYGCNVGGMGTLIGTPPNALLAGFFSESYGVEVGFAQWMIVGLPLVVVALPLIYVALTTVYPIELDELPGGTAIIDEERAQLGTISKAETRVAAIFALTALLWMTRPLLSDVIPGLSDAGIAIGASLTLFVVPSGTKDRALLSWDDAEKLPWGVLLLFGGGLSLASAISETGLAKWMGQGVSTLEGSPVLLVLVCAVALIVMLTEITSNTATTAAFLPILGAVAVGLGQNPFLLAVPAALGASCAFMLPVATPPNAIVYGSDLLSIPEMSRVGLWLNALFIIVVTGLAYALMGIAFGVELGSVPGWAAG
ncbi:sodium-dependent dicarboxylate transporter 2/3/5 [Salinibacter ruber]|uniref:Sodium-dependent dicarboxylate transporter 2/3/5 n=2 Tax=Salinibacter ruber TaxID=146919 RepID=A0A9X2Q119_9BACT|nr:sodium-dependent dicarboxylate transporter 2/3/5 [Salinibacter ruber]MCS3682531.1 sodium-dependent dicarboxylate transporter 2/3/5 [Salinibacter ruber]